MQDLKNLKDDINTRKFQSCYSENSIREVYLDYNKNIDDKIRIITQTNGKNFLEIIELSNEKDNELNNITWSPQENNFREEFDSKQISCFLYRTNYICVGFSNGSIRQYKVPNSEISRSSINDTLEINDNYYNSMFGNTQEDEKEKLFWLNNNKKQVLYSKLLMKHMGYPVCIQENKDFIYVLYDDGLLISSNISSNKGYNVTRYEEIFEGGIYFSINPNGNYIAVSTSKRKLIISSINNEINGKKKSEILLESEIFKKVCFGNNNKSKNLYNSLKLTWSSCGRYLFLPGEGEIRIIDIEKMNEMKIFCIQNENDDINSDICLIKEVKLDEGSNLLISLNLMGIMRIYIVDKLLSNIKQVHYYSLRGQTKSDYPISLDAKIVSSTNETKQKIYIATIFNLGECILNEIMININSFIHVNLENYSEKLNLKTKELEKIYEDQNSSSNLLWDEVIEDDDYDEVENINSKDRNKINIENIYSDNDSNFTEQNIDSSTRNEYNDYSDINDNNDNDDQDEYEYENWNKREFGKHIEYLKGKIERLKSIIKEGNQSQIPIQPGYTGDYEIHNSLNEENNEFLFCWNQSGYISYSIDEEGRTSLDMECYNSIDGPKKLRVYDTKGFDLGCIGMDGYLFGRKAKTLENGTFISSIIEYHTWRTWGRNDKSGWTKTLLPNEDLICMTCSRDFVAVVTSLRYLRIWKNSGLTISITKLIGAPISCVSNENFLLVITQREPFFTFKNIKMNYQNITKGRCNTYEILFFDIDRETMIYDGIMSITPETIIKWCGISTKGIPIIQDSSGQTFMLTKQWKNAKEIWVPCTNFGILESNGSCKYFILSIDDEHFNVLKLPDGFNQPIPLMAKNNTHQDYSTIKIPFNIPILGLPSIRQWINIIENDPTLNECITNDNVPWEVIDELRIKLDLKQNHSLFLDYTSDIQLIDQSKQHKLDREKLLMRLFMKLIIKQLVEPAFDVVKMFSFPKSFQIALEQAEKNGERILASKISQEIKIRSKFEREKNSKLVSKNYSKIDQNDNYNYNNNNNNGNNNIVISENDISHSNHLPNNQSESFLHSNTQIQIKHLFNSKSSSGNKNFNDSNKHVDDVENFDKTIQFCSDIIKRRKI